MPSEARISRHQDGQVQKSGCHSAAQTSRRLPPPTKLRAPPEAIVISSDDETEGPPTKRQKRSSVGPSTKAGKRKHQDTVPKTNKRRPYLIDLTSYDDNIEDTAVQPPRKRLDTKPNLTKETRENPILILDTDDEKEADDKEEEEQSDSDYDNIHEGYAVGWSTSAFEPDRHVSNTDVDVVGESVARLHLDRADLQFVHNSCKLAPLAALEAAHSNPRLEFWYKGSSSFRHSLPYQMRGPVHASYCGGRSRTGIFRHRSTELQLPLHNLKLLSRFRMADSSQCISQSSTKVLVASSTPGGTMEDEEDDDSRVDPYNSRNTLAMWTEDTREHWLQAHCVLSPRRKYYDIKCARFDPTNSNIFVSTGRDGSLIVWKYMKPGTNKEQIFGADSSEHSQADAQARYVPVKQWGRETHQGCCLDIVYSLQNCSDDTITFAAPCDNGNIFLHSYTRGCDGFRPLCRLQVSPNPTHPVGATLWGQQSTSKMLFASSEVDDAFHGAFDTNTGRLLYHFDQHENGEDLALHPDGSTLAFFTVEEHLHLRLYDVARGDKYHTSFITLPHPSPQLPNDTDHEVSTVSWSPDGLLLAVGCNDDLVHLYDVRYLERGPVQSLRHETRSSSLDLPLLSLPEEERTESKSYGITVLSWTSETCFKSPRIGLLTGGGDHCIALWDIKTACEERQVVAELDGHVGVAHFGDLSRGEKPLVAGDTDGHVYIYNFVHKR